MRRTSAITRSNAGMFNHVVQQLSLGKEVLCFFASSLDARKEVLGALKISQETAHCRDKMIFGKLHLTLCCHTPLTESKNVLCARDWHFRQQDRERHDQLEIWGELG